MEEFISRLIRHIPDEQFKTIRHYGVYSRRTKKLSKQLVSAWQKEARKWIVKAKSVLRRKRWNEKVKEHTGKDPMVCPKCECYYEYKGEVCLQDGKLKVKYAICQSAQGCLERMIRDFTGIQKTEKEEKAATGTKQLFAVKAEGQICLFDMQRERGNSA